MDQPLILSYTIFSRKRCPFRIPAIEKWHPFHIVPCLELCYPFNQMTDFPTFSYTSTSKIPTLSYTCSPKNIPLSGGASPYYRESPLPPPGLEERFCFKQAKHGTYSNPGTQVGKVRGGPEQRFRRSFAGGPNQKLVSSVAKRIGSWSSHEPSRSGFLSC